MCSYGAHTTKHPPDNWPAEDSRKMVIFFGKELLDFINASRIFYLALLDMILQWQNVHENDPSPPIRKFV